VQVPDTDTEPDADGTVLMKTVMTKAEEWDVINTKKPLWLRPPRQCEQEEYTEFYKQTFNAWDAPAAQTHFSVEGNVDFTALLYLPTEVTIRISATFQTCTVFLFPSALLPTRTPCLSTPSCNLCDRPRLPTVPST